MLDVEAKAEFFKVRTPLLSQGRLDTVLSETPRLRVWVKCYAEGGENALHAHTNEDHCFVVLQGRARFYDRAGNSREIGRLEGIMLPRGTFYWFQSCGDEPLVLLRVGALYSDEPNRRIRPDGALLPGDSPENKTVPPVVIPGAFFE